jgi:hypothetical protein
MVKISDGNTDLLSTLLQTSQDTQGKPIKWVKEKGDDNSVPAWSAEVKNEDGSKSVYSLSVAKALATVGLRTELSDEQKKAQEERGKKTNVRDGTVVQPGQKVPESKEDKEALKRAEKESEVGFTKSGSKIK